MMVMVINVQIIMRKLMSTTKFIDFTATVADLERQYIEQHQNAVALLSLTLWRTAVFPLEFIPRNLFVCFVVVHLSKQRRETAKFTRDTFSTTMTMRRSVVFIVFYSATRLCHLHLLLFCWLRPPYRASRCRVGCDLNINRSWRYMQKILIWNQFEVGFPTSSSSSSPVKSNKALAQEEEEELCKWYHSLLLLDASTRNHHHHRHLPSTSMTD